MRFLKTQIQQCLIAKKKKYKLLFIIHESHEILHYKRMKKESRWELLLAAAPCCTVQWTTYHVFIIALFTLVNSFFKKKKPVQLIDFTRTVQVNVNNNFFFKKISLRWIKFIHTVISILFLIIFYLILLHAKKIMETIVLVGWILYVIEL
jgi:hypothetical protein